MDWTLRDGTLESNSGLCESCTKTLWKPAEYCWECLEKFGLCECGNKLDIDLSGCSECYYELKMQECIDYYGWSVYFSDDKS